MKDKKITFKNIAGYSEEKKELREICNLIINRDKLIAAGGKMPKGLLLAGPSGVGKTLFAKALINESKCPFVEINPNDVSQEEEFTDYVKEQFQKAINQVPCILYIDQIDKMLGQSFPFGAVGGSDRGGTILNELNKYSDVDGLFILLVSCRTRSLDSSIVRSGRVDRIININVPSEKERTEIVSYYCENKKLGKDASVEKISKLLKGFTGADVETVLNNAVIKSFSKGEDSICFKDVNDAYYDMLFKTSIKEINIPEDELESLSYHEAGHAVIGLLSDPESVTYASIKPRGNSMGFVSRDYDEFRSFTLEEKRNDLCIALAGRAAEETYLNRKSEGCISDLIKAKVITQEIVRKYGMLGLKYLDLSDNDWHYPIASITGQKAAEIEKQEDELLSDCFTLTIHLLHSNNDLFHDVANLLKEKKNLSKDDLDAIVEKYNIKELNMKKYQTIKQRVGMYGYVNQFILQKEFTLGYFQANLVLKKLQKDKLVSNRFGSKGYDVIAN